MFELLLGPIVGWVILGIIVAVIVLIYARAIYKNAGPDEALVITGRKSRRRVVDGASTEESGQRVVHGQGVFITPFFQKAFKLSLRSRAIDVTALAQDKNGVTITVDAVAIVKVGDAPESIRAAAQRFLGQDKNIDNFAQEVLSGSLRASIGATDVMTIIQRRDELGATVLSTARDSLVNQGLDVDSFEIKGISDDNNYISDIGRAEQAKVRRQAEVAESLANREAREAAVAAEQAVAEAENALALRKAALQLDTDRAAAEAAAARPLAEAKAQQSIVVEQEATAQRRAQLRKAELESEVNAVADAEAYRVKVTAEAAGQAAIVAAQSQRDSRIAAAEATRAEGEANADAIRARGAAEAEATRLQAEAVAQQSEAFLQLRLVELLPQIAHELAAPMGNIDNLTVVSTDGASQLTKNVANGFSEIDGVLGATMGVGIKDLLGNLVGGAAAGAAFANGANSQSAKDAAPARVVSESSRTQGSSSPRRAASSPAAGSAGVSTTAASAAAPAQHTATQQAAPAQSAEAQARAAQQASEAAAKQAAAQRAASQQAAQAATSLIDATADAAQEAIARRANQALDSAMDNVSDRLRRNQ